MKKIILILLTAFISVQGMAQQQADLRRKISVSGSSELELTPNIIYVNISLREYFKDNNNKKKVEITELETQLYNAILKAGIPKENLTISNLSSWNYFNNNKTKNPDFLASKQYRLKLNDLYKYNEILDGIDAKGIQNTYIESYDHSNIQEIKKDLQIKALKDAQAKAKALLEAIGSKLGDPLDIQEQVNYYGNDFKTMAVASTARASEAVTLEAPEIEVKKITLKFTMNVIFEIK